MANEVQVSYQSGKTVYFQVRNAVGQIWSVLAGAFQAYATANIDNYDISMTEQGTASGFYAGTFPTAITTPGVYSIVAKQQLAGTVAETDPTIAQGDLQWNGSTTAPLSDAATSGQVGQFLPMRPFRGQMVLNFPFRMVASTDHITPFTSGVISGQIKRDGGSFGALQSGAFTENGLGWYTLQALTSGDLLANTVALHFTGVGVSGGAADPVALAMLLQRSSGQGG